MPSKTLAQRLAEGRIPVAEALRYSMLLADALRQLHDSGRMHGAIAPITIGLTATGVELLPAQIPEALIPYAAPEVLDGEPATPRSDIFSFGAVVYEMLSGKRAFLGTERDSLASSGSPAVDRLVGGCLAKDPSARMQRIQKVMPELKLLSVSAARAAAAAVPRRDPDADSQLRAEIQQVEARIAARLQANDKALAEMQRLAGDVLNRDAGAESEIRSEMLQLEARVAGRLKGNEKIISEIQLTVAEALNEQPAVAPDLVPRAEMQEMERRLTDALERMEQRLAAAMDRIERLEKAAPVSAVEEIQRSLQAQAHAIESARTALAQTDDLVERVVEALESLQTTVLENSEGNTLALS